MTRPIARIALILSCALFAGVAFTSFARQPTQGQRGPAAEGQATRTPPVRPPVFFREDWKQTPEGGEHEISQNSVSNPNLELKLYGSAKQIVVNGVAGDEANPIRLFTGTCDTTCAVALRDKTNYVDLTGLARIIWVTRTSGFHMVHPIIKLADGTWLVGDHAEGSNGTTRDFHVAEFPIDEVHWLKLDIDKVVAKGEFVDHPDLSKVDEIGFTDLMPGSGHGLGGFTIMARFEVDAKAVSRDAGTQQNQTQLKPR